MSTNNRWWTENDGHYELHFEKYYEDTVVLSFSAVEGEEKLFIYSCADTGDNEEYASYESVEAAKEAFVEMYEEHLIEQIKYQEELLRQFRE